jgi:hypothetical protein
MHGICAGMPRGYWIGMHVSSSSYEEEEEDTCMAYVPACPEASG